MAAEPTVTAPEAMASTGTASIGSAADALQNTMGILDRMGHGVNTAASGLTGLAAAMRPSATSAATASPWYEQLGAQ